MELDLLMYTLLIIFYLIFFVFLFVEKMEGTMIIILFILSTFSGYKLLYDMKMNDMLNIDISSNNKISRSVSENEISKYVEARMQEIFNLIIREISRADIKDPLTYGIVLTGGGAELTNLITLAKNTLGVSVRRGSPIRIEGAEDVANKSYYATVMGLLLWPLYANDHVREQRSDNQGLKGFIRKIRHTIEEYMF